SWPLKTCRETIRTARFCMLQPDLEPAEACDGNDAASARANPVTRPAPTRRRGGREKTEYGTCPCDRGDPPIPRGSSLELLPPIEGTRTRGLLYPLGYADLPAPRRRPPKAAHSVPRQRHAADRGGHGPRGLLGQRVDPVSPDLALPCEGARRFRADRARGVGAGRPCAPAFQDHRGRARGRRGLRAQASDV